MNPIDGYLLFFAVCIALAMFGVRSERGIWTILASSAALNAVMSVLLWSRVDSPYEVCGWMAQDALPAFALARYAWNRLGKIMAALFILLCSWHTWFYVDFQTGAYLIYDYYTGLISLVTIAMLALGANGALHIGKRIYSGLASGLGVRPPMAANRSFASDIRKNLTNR